MQNLKLIILLLSHGHMDHLHFPSLKKLSKLNKDAIVIVPKGYKKILTAMGYKNVHLIRTGDTFEDDFLKITAMKQIMMVVDFI